MVLWKEGGRQGGREDDEMSALLRGKREDKDFLMLHFECHYNEKASSYFVLRSKLRGCLSI